MVCSSTIALDQLAHSRNPASLKKAMQQTSSPLLRVIHFVKFLANFSGRNLINPEGLHQSTGKEKEDWTVICLRPPKSVKF